LLFLLKIESQDAKWCQLDPTQRRLQVMAGVKALLASLARETPLLILVEDLHWADAETIRVLQGLAAELAGLRIVLLGARRGRYSKEGGVAAHPPSHYVDRFSVDSAVFDDRAPAAPGGFWDRAEAFRSRKLRNARSRRPKESRAG